MLRTSKRSLQRFRSEYGLRYRKISRKSYYKESDVLEFISRNMEEVVQDGEKVLKMKDEAKGTALLEEDTMDNQDVCMLLHVSKRTLQRYRSDGLLPYRMHRHKTYYRRADVELFISTHMREILRDRAQDKADNTKRKSNDKKTNRKN